MKLHAYSGSPRFRRALGPIMIIAAATGFTTAANAIELDNAIALPMSV